MQLYVWWRVTVAAAALMAAVLPIAARAVAGPPGAVVHVRWQPSIDAAARHALETRFRLADGRRLADDTWRYDLVDTSGANIRALVGHPSIADTHDIDRSRATATPTAERTRRRQHLRQGEALVLAADVLASALAALAALLAAAGVSGRASTPQAIPPLLRELRHRFSGAVRAALGPAARLLMRGIPDVDARTAGFFRIVFGSAVVVYFASHSFGAAVLDATFDVKLNGELHSAVLAWLRRHPGVVDSLTPWLVVSGAAFTVGALTRTSYALFVAAAILWAFVAIYVDSLHPHSTLLLALVMLLPSRWGDALSVDAWRRGDAVAPRHGRIYGYSPWVPGLVLGVAFAAAAWAKLVNGPSWTSWVLNGTIQYHFITDSIGAPVDWGLRFVHYPRLAIVASLAAVATEALVVTAAFSRRESYRLVVGLAALALLAGFWLFMGVVWSGWWLLLLGFLPWSRFSRSASVSRLEPARAARPTPPVYATAIAALIAQQVWVSALAIERAPMFSNYPMYSATWSSLEAFNASRPPVYRVLAETSQGTRELPCTPSEGLVSEFRAAVGGSADAASSVWRQLRGCGEDLSAVRQVVFEGYWRRFDTDRMAFSWMRGGGTLGPLPAHGEEAGTP